MGMDVAVSKSPAVNDALSTKCGSVGSTLYRINYYVGAVNERMCWHGIDSSHPVCWDGIACFDEDLCVADYALGSDARFWGSGSISKVYSRSHSFFAACACADAEQ